MKRQDLTKSAIAILLMTAPAVAIAQTDTAPLPGEAAPAELAPEGTSALDAPSGMHLDVVDGFIVSQSVGQVLGSNLLNVDVMGAAGEQIGSVNDLLIDSDGRVLGIIVGVGGFLGMGQRDVALPIDDVQFVLAGDTAAVPGTQDLTAATPPTDPAVAPPPAAGTQPLAPDTTAQAPAGQVPGDTMAQPGATPGTAPGTGWGWWGGEGQLQHIQVNATQEQLEAAPEFTRLDAAW